MEQIEIVYNKENGLWEIALEDAVKKCEQFVKDNELADFKIKSDNDYRLIRKQRTLLNNKSKEISDTRKQAAKVLTGEFVRGCKELESIISQATERMTAKMDAYKPKPQKEISVTLVIKGTNLNALNKIKTQAKKYGLTVEEENENAKW